MPLTTEQHAHSHALYMTEKIQSAIDTIATAHQSQPGAATHIALSEGSTFPELRHIQVALTERTLAITEPSGATRNIDLEELVTELASQNYDQLSQLRRALGQIADGRPLGGDGMEG